MNTDAWFKKSEYGFCFHPKLKSWSFSPLGMTLEEVSVGIQTYIYYNSICFRAKRRHVLQRFWTCAWGSTAWVPFWRLEAQLFHSQWQTPPPTISSGKPSLTLRGEEKTLTAWGGLTEGTLLDWQCIKLSQPGAETEGVNSLQRGTKHSSPVLLLPRLAWVETLPAALLWTWLGLTQEL